MLSSCKGSVLHLVDGPEDGFWVSEPIGREGQQVGYIKFEATPEDINEPIIFSSGQDGYYFDIVLEGRLSAIKSAYSLFICPSRYAEQKKCRKFTLRKFNDAVDFVCGK